MFHYGYFIASLAYGFFAGLIRSILNTTKKNTVTFTIISTFLAGLITTLLCLYLYTSAIYGENGKRIFQFTLFNFSIDIDR
jgi:biotin transporter BioY